RCMKSPGGGPALLFEQAVLRDGAVSPMPVAINLFGSPRRISLSLGVDQLDRIGDRIAELLHVKVPESWREKLALVPKLLELSKFPPRTVGGTPPCQEAVRRGPEVDLRHLPIITCWPEDGGPY